ncbi:uncharacterized protein LOC110054667 isoform X2 [Orbicella faveolata]|uniref:uncharacterized protein LOC110054667 isoform X2 n=1 Tax=Orbicella faveolata TaxID=48498 RepID=UPI0009E35C63|nr:uncharacterized protein LOC110054667 isoform X2 [Orbicella faveolata]
MIELAPVGLPPPEQGEAECGGIELAVVGLPPPEQEQREKDVSVVRDVRKRTTIRLVLPASSSKQETEESLEPGDTQPKLSSQKKQEGGKKLNRAKCKPKTDDSSSTGSKGSLGEESVTYETAL